MALLTHGGINQSSVLIAAILVHMSYLHVLTHIGINHFSVLTATIGVVAKYVLCFNRAKIHPRDKTSLNLGSKQ